uniref:Uncharacterized protein n=1 Tax=Rhizophora mucronata TaxID=61149 RepID=A0A2P2N241_RHIMU
MWIDPLHVLFDSKETYVLMMYDLGSVTK